MRSYIQLIGLETGDSVPSLLLVTDTNRYVINAGEGAQRFCMEHRARLSRVDGIFLTRVSTENCGGLPGMLMTLADLGCGALKLYGGRGLHDYTYGMRHFMHRSKTSLDATEIQENSADAEDAAPTLSPIHLGSDFIVHPVVTRGAKMQGDPALLAGAAEASLRELTAYFPILFQERNSLLYSGGRGGGGASGSATGEAVSNRPLAAASGNAIADAHETKRSYITTIATGSVFPSIATSTVENISVVATAEKTEESRERRKESGGKQATRELKSTEERASQAKMNPNPQLRSSFETYGTFAPLCLLQWPLASPSPLLRLQSSVAAATSTSVAAAAVNVSASSSSLDDTLSAVPPPFVLKQRSLSLPPSSAPPVTLEGSRLSTVSYIFATVPSRGRFLPAAALALGVKKGPDFARLTKGESVKVQLPASLAHSLKEAKERGTAGPAASVALAAEYKAKSSMASTANKGAVSTASSTGSNSAAASSVDASEPLVEACISPSDVMEDEFPSRYFAVVDAPTIHHLVDLQRHELFQQFYAVAAAPTRSGDEGKDAGARSAMSLLYHFSPPTVVENEAYRLWMASFGTNTRHILCNLGGSRRAAADSGTLTASLDLPSAHVIASHPFMHRSQAQHICKLHLLHPRTFPLPFPLPLLLQRKKAAIDALSTKLLSSGDEESMGKSKLSESETGAIQGDDSSVSLLQSLFRSRHLLNKRRQSARASLESASIPLPSTAIAEDVCVSDMESSRSKKSSPLDGIIQTSTVDSDAAVDDDSSKIDWGDFGTDFLLKGKAEMPVSASVASLSSSAAPHTSLAPVLQASYGSPLEIQQLPNGPEAESRRDETFIPPFLTPDEPLQQLIDLGEDTVQLILSQVQPLSRITACSGEDMGSSSGNSIEASEVVGSRTPSPPEMQGTAATELRVPPNLAITFTGTSSAIPSKYRNVSGTLVHLPMLPTSAPSSESSFSSSSSSSTSFAHSSPSTRYPYASILLDGGEGTVGQLFRRFGVSSDASTPSPSVDSSLGDFFDVLLSIRIIWISHMHADHHLGILRLISERQRAIAFRAPSQATPPPLLIIGPTRLYCWLLETSRLQGFAVGMAGSWRFMDAEHFLHARKAVEVALPPSSGDCSTDAALSELNGPSKKRAREEEKEVVVPSVDESMALTDDCAVHTDTLAAPLSSSPPNRPTLEAYRYQRRHYIEAMCIPLPTERSTASSSLEAKGGDGDADGDKGGQGHHPRAADLHLASSAFVASTLASIGITALRTVPVPHGTKAYALRLEILSPPLSSLTTQAERESSLAPVTVSAASSMPTASPTEASCRPWSLVFSGDTRPCEEVVDLGHGALAPVNAAVFVSLCPPPLPANSPHFAMLEKGCSLLIHEATFESTEEGAENALMKRHSTVGEACLVAKTMRANFTLLTHFSARYPKVPVLGTADVTDFAIASSVVHVRDRGRGHSSSSNSSSSSSSGSRSFAVSSSHEGSNAAPPKEDCIFVAYDLMTAWGADFLSLPALLPTLHLMFAEEEVGDDSIT